MLRRVSVMVATVALVGGLATVQAGASPSVHSKAVCGVSHSATRFECFAMVRTNSSGRVLSSPDVPSGYSPAQFHSGYNLPTTTSGNNTIALVDAYNDPNIYQDLATYDSTFGLASFPKCQSKTQFGCFIVLNQQGRPKPLPTSNSGWALEESLDVEMSHAICQNCRIILYESNNSSNRSLAAAVNSAAKQGADEISNSYGTYLSDCTQSGYNHPNVAVTVSAGDSGSGIACPAVESTVVAIGGTSLYLNSNGSYNHEAVWAGTGSGCSTQNKAQSWQLSASNWGAIGCGTGRGMNDVSADADPATGAAVYDSYGYGGWVQVGGTSVASPLIAGVYALAGNASSWTYPAQSAYLSPSSLHDVTQGANGSCGIQCQALTGYDLPTGIGTPNGLGGF